MSKSKTILINKAAKQVVLVANNFIRLIVDKNLKIKTFYTLMKVIIVANRVNREPPLSIFFLTGKILFWGILMMKIRRMFISSFMILGVKLQPVNPFTLFIVVVLPKPK